MPHPFSPLMRYATPLLLVCLCWGCSHTAVVRSWEPAEIDVAGMSRVVVMDFSGDHGEAVSAALSSRMWENKFYTVVDRTQVYSPIQTAAYHDGAALGDMLGPARDAGIDGVLLGDVVEYSCEDRVLQSNEFNFGTETSETHRGRRTGTGFGVEMNETLIREGTVTIAFRLVDVNTGEVRASRNVSRNFEGRLHNGEGHLPNKGEILDNLTRQCVEEIVSMLAPHEIERPIELATSDFWAKGKTEVKRGVNLAKKGNWDAAEEAWQRALVANPDNHAALFNLSLVAAQRQEFEAAEEYAMKAVRISHCDCYAHGLEAIRHQRTAFEKSEEQREARVDTADETIWR